MAGTIPFGCGQCQPCRINRRRIWTWRMYLESLAHRESSFVTLTYSPQSLPSDGSLKPRHVQLWLKRLRKAMSAPKMSGMTARFQNAMSGARTQNGPVRLRFFLCGEYGDQSWRPHYHACLFGAGLSHESLIRKSWPLGFVDVQEFTRERAQYTVGYVVKKMTRKDDPRLQGRVPEFARMSLRPGIGAVSMDVVAETMFRNSSVFLDSDGLNGDVPQSLRLGRQSVVLGRYLRKVLREKIGMDEASAEAITREWSISRSQEMLAMCVDAGAAATDAKRVLFEKNLGRMQSLEARQKIEWGKKL